MPQNDPGGSPASNLDSNLKSEKSSFSSFFLTSKLKFGLWANLSFLLPLGLSFCMRSLKYSNCPGKPVRAPRGAQKYANFEKLTPKIFKMSFFMKFKTSPALPPYYSVEPMKYALRVIFWSRECLGMILEAPQPQIWTQSWNPKNHHFHHFLWPLSSSLVRGRIRHSRFPSGSPFACAH